MFRNLVPRIGARQLVLLAVLAMMSSATTARAALTPVSPSTDGGTAQASPGLTYVFDTAGVDPALGAWNVRFSSKPKVDSKGRLTRDPDLGEYDRSAEQVSPTRWQTGSDEEVPTKPKVVYWQVFGAESADCFSLDCTTPRTVGPVWKVTIAGPPRIRAFGSQSVEVPRTRVYIAQAACDAAPCKITGDVQASVHGKRIFNVWRNAAARSVDLTIKERTTFADTFAVWSSRTDFKESALLRTIKGSGPVTLTARIEITDESGNTARLTRHVTLKRRVKQSTGSSTSSPSAPSQEGQAEDAAGRALDERNLLYYVARCDLIGPKEYDCIAKPLAGADQPDRHATVRRVGSRWYVGTFVPVS